MQSGDITFEDIQHPVIDPLRRPGDDQSGHRRAGHRTRSVWPLRNDVLYLEDLPVFYWPSWPPI